MLDIRLEGFYKHQTTLKLESIQKILGMQREGRW